jgi:hypothetical protein
MPYSNKLSLSLSLSVHSWELRGRASAVSVCMHRSCYNSRPSIRAISQARVLLREVRSLSSRRGRHSAQTESEATGARIYVHVKIPPCELFVKRWPDQQQPVQHFIRRVVQSGRRCKYRRCITLVTIITAKCGACWLIICLCARPHIYTQARGISLRFPTRAHLLLLLLENEPPKTGSVRIGRRFLASLPLVKSLFCSLAPSRFLHSLHSSQKAI